MGSNPTPSVLVIFNELAWRNGRRGRLKIYFFIECRFKSDSGYDVLRGGGGSLMVERESPKFLVWVRVPPFLLCLGSSIGRASDC